MFQMSNLLEGYDSRCLHEGGVYLDTAFIVDVRAVSLALWILPLSIRSCNASSLVTTLLVV